MSTRTRILSLTLSMILTAATACGQDPEPADTQDMSTPSGEDDMDTPAPDMDAPPAEDMDAPAPDMPTEQVDMNDDPPPEVDMAPPEEDMSADMSGDTPDMNAAPDMAPDCTIDTDSDGLTDCDEMTICTDPFNIDTDGDLLTDREEFMLNTDPCDPDTDGDGLNDERENYFGFDPNDPSTLGDMVLDGERFVASACAEPESEPVLYYKDAAGDWTLALGPTFSNYSALVVPGAARPVAAAVYDDPVNEVAGFTLSLPLDGRDVVQRLRALSAPIEQVSTITQDFYQGEFTTHDLFPAAPADFELAASGKSVRKLRDDLLFAMAPFARADVTGGLPLSSGNVRARFFMKVSAIERNDRLLIQGAVAPEELYEARDAVRFRLSDLTNTTGVARSNAGHRLECHPFPIDTDVPAADFYWVLDQSGSMTSFNNTIRSFSGEFYNLVVNAGIDFRLGVTNMEESFGGKLRATTGWHTDPQTFSTEIEDYVIDCSSNFSGCSASEEYGLYAAEEGIRFMTSAAATPVDQMRPNAAIVPIIMTDEEPESLEDGKKPGGPSTPRQQLLADYQQFFSANTFRTYAIVSDDRGCGLEDGADYGDVALATGGASASLCSSDLTTTIVQIVEDTVGGISSFRLPHTPISATLRVYQAAEDGRGGVWVPRSRADGFDYFPQRNALAFFGSYRPQAPSKKACAVDADCPSSEEQCRAGACELRAPLQVAVHYQTFVNKTKCYNDDDCGLGLTCDRGVCVSSP